MTWFEPLDSAVSDGQCLWAFGHMNQQVSLFCLSNLELGSDSRFLTLASFVGWTCCLESLAQSLSCTWAEALAPLPLGFDAWP